MRWEQRPVEIANLLSPPFCAILLRDAVHAYAQKDLRGLNYLLVYLILPLVVHSKTRQAIPNRPSYTLIEWVEKYKIDTWMLVDHIQQLTPFTKEALIWSINQGVIVFSDQEGNYGNLLATSKKLPNDESWSQSSTPVDCRNKAATIGEWFAEIADATTIYRTFGIRP